MVPKSVAGSGFAGNLAARGLSIIAVPWHPGWPLQRCQSRHGQEWALPSSAIRICHWMTGSKLQTWRCLPFLQRRNLAETWHGKCHGKVQVLGLEVGKVDTSNFFSWLRVKLAKCEHRRWDFLRRQIFFELDWGELSEKSRTFQIYELLEFIQNHQNPFKVVVLGMPGRGLMP